MTATPGLLEMENDPTRACLRQGPKGGAHGLRGSQPLLSRGPVQGGGSLYGKSHVRELPLSASSGLVRHGVKTPIPQRPARLFPALNLVDSPASSPPCAIR